MKEGQCSTSKSKPSWADLWLGGIIESKPHLLWQDIRTRTRRQRALPVASRAARIGQPARDRNVISKTSSSCMIYMAIDTPS